MFIEEFGFGADLEEGNVLLFGDSKENFVEDWNKWKENNMNPKSIYIHIPFCKNICKYCDFCKMFYNEKWANDYIDSLDETVKPSACLGCSACTNACPQNIDVPDIMKKVNK